MIKTPFPWFGGKSKAADLIWSRFGDDVKNYVEPFFGSGAVFINRPESVKLTASCINDLDGNIVNFWRAIEKFPEQVATHANHIVNEIDLHARHLWLVNNAKSLSLKLMADPDYCEPKTAGWWAWGCCCWIGGGWCSGKGPWGAIMGDDGVAVFAKISNIGQGVKRKLPHLGNAGRGVNRQLPHLGDAGRGVNRQLPHLGDAGQGVNRQLPHLSNAGQGVNRKLPHLGDESQGVNRREFLENWFFELQDRLRDTRITCGDWERILSIRTVTRFGTCAVLLDPPYSTTAPVYAHDGSDITKKVNEWCVANGDNGKLRIAICGHDGEHNNLTGMGWTVETWDKQGGYQGADERERIWFSPHCIKGKSEVRTDLF